MLEQSLKHDAVDGVALCACLSSVLQWLFWADKAKVLAAWSIVSILLADSALALGAFQPTQAGCRFQYLVRLRIPDVKTECLGVATRPRLILALASCVQRAHKRPISVIGAWQGCIGGSWTSQEQVKLS